MATQQKRACCSGPPLRLTYIRIRGGKVGMVGVEETFERLYQAGRRDDDALEQELVEQVRPYNYIAPGSEADYGWALHQAYRAYVRAKEGKDSKAWQTHTRP